MTVSASTTQTDAPSAAPSTEAAAPAPAPRPRPAPIRVVIGDIVLLKLAPNIIRPMQVTARDLWRKDDKTDPELRINGTIFCEPEDHTTPAFRSLMQAGDPARIHGRPERTHPVAYGEMLRRGTGIGEWQPRPTNLPAGK